MQTVERPDITNKRFNPLSFLIVSNGSAMFNLYNYMKFKLIFINSYKFLKERGRLIRDLYPFFFENITESK